MLKNDQEYLEWLTDALRQRLLNEDDAMEFVFAPGRLEINSVAEDSAIGFTVRDEDADRLWVFICQTIPVAASGEGMLTLQIDGHERTFRVQREQRGPTEVSFLIHLKHGPVA